MTTELLKINKDSLKKAAELIKQGQIVAFPTETVYGLGADVFNENAVKSIFVAKGRPDDNPLIVHVAKKEDIKKVAREIPLSAQLLIDKFMPGPITIVLPKRKEIPDCVTGNMDTVGIRIPEHIGAREFIEACGCPIPAPSANSSGKPSPTSAMHVFDDLEGKIPLILDGGDCDKGVESTVISLCTKTPLLLRPGVITYEMLTDVLGKVDIHPSVLNDGLVDKAASPGMKYKHYSPKARVIIVDAPVDTACRFYDFALKNNKKPIIIWKEEELENVLNRKCISLYKNSDTLIAAKNLFNILRQVDKDGFDTVFITSVPTSDAGLSVMNRMLRASAFTVIDKNTDENKLKTILQLN
ncbi:MAG: threonylcarbamoyl-AMP synthase [Clostridiales bacterium]|nr:threonylcarbamoyl-AMP synthase [Clostridiales bacterium]